MGVGGSIWEKREFEDKSIQATIPALALASCGTLSKLFHFPRLSSFTCRVATTILPHKPVMKIQ